MTILDKNIKIVFQTKQENDVVTWEKHVDEIINGIECGKRTFFKVYMKNLMPIAEMDKVVCELCETINYHFDTVSKYSKDAECIAAGTNDMLLSATYYVELK
ncbi:MAG: hypothetical protein IJ826_03305 [Bacteroidaceae bacterium]|nr:hypothetical protein [Bacteroidaceae bacterium]